MATNNNRMLMIIIAIVAVLAVGYGIMKTQQDNRTATEKMGDAMNELSKGVDNAAEQLQ